MALDKVVDSAALNAQLTAIANALRTATGESGQYVFPTDFVAKIEALAAANEDFGHFITADEFVGSVPTATDIRPHAFIMYPPSSLIGQDGAEFRIPDAVETLLAYSFNGSKFTKITGGTGIKTIQGYAFHRSELTTLDLSRCVNLETIAQNAAKYSTGWLTANTNYASGTITTLLFTGCEKLTSIGQHSFRQHPLTNIDFTGCVALESIGESAFISNHLPSLDLSDCESLKTIGNAVFRYNSLTNLDLSGLTSLESIGDYAFSPTGTPQSVTEIDLSESENLKTIGQYAFGADANNHLTAGILKFPTHKLTTIGQQAFRELGLANQSSYNNGELTVRATNLNANAFIGCSGIQKLNLEFNKPGISPFSGCTGITEVHMLANPNTSGWPSNITTYPIFYNCPNVTDIYVPWSEGTLPETYFFLAEQNPTWHYDTVVE